MDRLRWQGGVMGVKPLSALALACLLLLAAGCQGPKLEERIDRGMAEFDSWPPETQEAVRKGEIEVGFTKEQVRMAWGEPDYVTRDRAEGGRAEHWIWEKKTPRVGIGIGLGSWGGSGGVSGSVGTSVGGDRKVKRSVWFDADGKVTSFSP